MKSPAVNNRPRKSASAARSRLAELERLRAMSVEDRIKAALTMSHRYSWLKPVSGSQHQHAGR